MQHFLALFINQGIVHALNYFRLLMNSLFGSSEADDYTQDLEEMELMEQDNSCQELGCPDDCGSNQCEDDSQALPTPSVSDDKTQNTEPAVKRVLLDKEWYKKAAIDNSLVNEGILPSTNRKRFIEEEEWLKDLLPALCEKCGKRLTMHNKVVGAVYEASWSCEPCRTRRSWASSHKVGSAYSLNIVNPASVTISGNQFLKVKHLFRTLSLACVGSTTYKQVSRLYIEPTINTWFKAMQTRIFSSLGNEPVVVAGDGRNDSPGHCAQYCSNSILLHDYGYLIHTEIGDKREVNGKSPNMEADGCKRALTYLKDCVNVTEVVTDAHPQILALLGKCFIIS